MEEEEAEVVAAAVKVEAGRMMLAALVVEQMVDGL